MTGDEGVIARLLAVVRRLAASADSQIPYLVTIGTAPSADELALEFDDTYCVVVSRVTELPISHAAVEALARLDDALRIMSGALDPDLWTTEALVESEQWSAVRRIAQEAVVQLEV